MAEISLTGDQMLNVLEAIANHGPVSAADVSRICDMNRTVAHRLISTLAQRAYVRRAHDGYVLGSAVLNLSRHFDRDISGVARPYLQKLAQQVGETVVLHSIDRYEAVVTDQALGNKHLVRVEHVPGSRHSLMQGASGWSLLAFQDEKFIEKVLERAADPAGAMRRLAETRQFGYALSHDELQLGVHGLAAPVLEGAGRCTASVAILVPTARAQGLERLAPALLMTTRAISRALSDD